MQITNMKKIIFCCLLTSLLGLAVSAQVIEKKSNNRKTKIETPHSETKIKKTSTPKQKIHNILHPKRKQYSGVRIKHEVKKG